MVAKQTLTKKLGASHISLKLSHPKQKLLQPPRVHAGAHSPHHLVIHANTLGGGTYGSVHLATIYDLGGAVRAAAVKLVPTEKMRHDAIAEETEVLRQLSCGGHPSAVRFFGWLCAGSRRVSTDDAGAHAGLEQLIPTCHCLVMERLGGELFDYVCLRQGLPEAEVASLLQQIANGLHDAHTRGIAHRDVKLDIVTSNLTRWCQA